MLTALQIRDFAIIDRLELELYRGLTVLTGETGAGKSILVDALQLLAGGRAGPEMIRHGAERAEICGTFDLADAPEALGEWLEAQALSGEELIVRRVLSADGRTRAWLNGQAVPAQLLREAGNLLIDIHGQHEFQSLTRTACQRELLDEYGRLEPLLTEVGGAYRQWHERRSRALELESAAQDREARLELLRYQVGELEALTLQPGEVERLSEERSRLMNRGRLAQAAQSGLMHLYQDEQANAHLGVSRALQALRAAAALDAQLTPVVTLAEEAEMRIREAARELERYGESLELDTTRQNELESRLAAIEELARKHRVSPPELIARTEQLSAELVSLERAEVDLVALRQELAAVLERYRRQAHSLSEARQAAARSLAKAITSHMQSLGMSGGRFEVTVSSAAEEPAPHGGDEVGFQVSANPGQPVRALAKVASGGELSRLSLAVQVASSARETRCMVFDEVDSGIGGAVAEIVGRELRSLGERGQVLCVTHLPQVASQGHHHLRVSKLTDGRTTRTSLTELSVQDRIEELARMLGGIDVTSKAREHAQEMLEGASGPPTSPKSSRSNRTRAARRG
jgi:DNA repair protein RecN (Recombination protein N)